MILLDLNDVPDVLVVGRVYESLGGPVLVFSEMILNVSITALCDELSLWGCGE